MPSTTDTAVADRRILIVDDHRIFRELMALALSTQPGMTCVGTAANAADGIAMAAELLPDVVSIDIEMPGQDGLAAARRIRAVAPAAVVVVVSAHCDRNWAAKAERAGAAALVPKGGSFVELTAALRRVRPAPACPTPPADDARAAPVPALTARQHDLLACLSQGLSPAATAEILGITVQT